MNIRHPQWRFFSRREEQELTWRLKEGQKSPSKKTFLPRITSVFVTMPDFEMSIPVGLSPPNHKHWLAVGLSTPAPWFLLTYRVTVRRGQHRDQTLAVAWEKTLRELLATPGFVAMSIYSISRMKGTPSMRRIEEVWIPSDKETLHTGPLLFRMEGSISLCDPFSGAAVPAADGRTLVFQDESSR